MPLTIVIPDDLPTTQAKVLAALTGIVVSVDGDEVQVTDAVETKNETVNVLGHPWEGDGPDTTRTRVLPLGPDSVVTAA